MNAKSAIVLVAFAAFASFGSVACATNTDADAESGSSAALETSTDSASLSESVKACRVDADCVAIPVGGCCNAGRLEAVNKDQVEAYSTAMECKSAAVCPPIHPMIERRVAQCDHATRQCAMIAPEEIACGGFVINRHECPQGFECSFTGAHVDSPGRCVK